MGLVPVQLGGVHQAHGRGGCEEFAALKMPVLLVTGENTGATFKALIEAQTKCLPSATVVRVPNAAHSVQANNPTGFAQAVNAFLR